MDFTIQYFERRQAENPQFYYAKTVDKETNSVTGLFWVDGRARALYPKYKDCIFFDTTFCTNRYNMPFAPIVGVNNHLQTVLLGCALMPNEQIQNFKWVFQHFLLAMNNEHPLNIMTDQDKAMETAISQALPNTVHRCCKWHVQRKAREKLGWIMSRDEVFEQAFYTCINDSDTVDEFEENWQHMIRCFDLVDNKHLCNMWKTRETWAPTFFRNYNCGFYAILFLENFDGVVMKHFDESCIPNLQKSIAAHLIKHPSNTLDPADQLKKLLELRLKIKDHFSSSTSRGWMEFVL
ncbi:protein FAR1-RELATED SEQUENCE 3-like [Aegilops tauschii subsp. strangulata]|uniref:protein FAR1-RELATED SEQUENCE 3-like n=1 Tax=Aegilops tauschii subsp. strangulata TaxID=200361 RepID=UPI00098A58D6|nr:protein FAR1-RELATED SEQUENCE 3-like [Aegilops tauschii subsp. strangulata]